MLKAINPLIREYGPKSDLVDAELNQLWKEPDESKYAPTAKHFAEDAIVKGKVVSANKDRLIVDFGAKTVGVVDGHEFEDGNIPKVGEEITVLIEELENEDGLIGLSKRKADRKMNWENVVKKHKEGDVVNGRITKKIKGGLLIDIGVPAFLPASQVSIRRTRDINEFIGDELECEIIKIDEARENIVVSARKLQERNRERLKQALLSEIEEGQVRDGVVKNIADFGAFVDLGGIDGLLHITDMTWGRIQHPSEVVQINMPIKVKVLKVDRERERIALGMKQLSSSPWEGIAERYPVGSRHKGSVVNIMSYGAFIKLQEGIEGLVHVSEMSWTKRVNDPREVVQPGDSVEVVILGVNEEKQEISLGMKQLETNPWDRASEKYQPGVKVKGTIRNLTSYGAFVEIEPGIDGLLHVSDMSWTRKVSHPNEMVKKGDVVECIVLAVDTEKRRIALGMKQLETDPWESTIPKKFAVNTEVEGTITKVTNFGVFVELTPELEGLLHISELAEQGGEESVKVGQKIKVKVIKLDPKERKIGLTAVNAPAQA
ncbi:MAG: 30S ribosomal protein S1 [Planctomycetaceae bacterium]|nr:30S ribosomal protein S1 [Planctomycetota bacterium]NUO15369.1 30S ribosomal protein S1 [Planctomycetaceae bacterium]HRJ77415.1 30S ribosomal protein S1 [Planctomycetota bacterium]